MSAKPLLVAVALLAFLPSTLSWAVCAPHRFTEPARIKLDGDSVMIVVHATSTHDARFATKRGLDEAVRYAKDKHIPVIYLLDDSPEQFYFMEDCNPDHWVRSEGGEIAFEVPQTQLYIVGGHLEMCLSTTLHDIVYQWAKLPPHPGGARLVDCLQRRAAARSAVALPAAARRTGGRGRRAGAQHGHRAAAAPQRHGVIRGSPAAA